MCEFKAMFVQLEGRELRHAEPVDPINVCLREWAGDGWELHSLAPLGYRPGVLVTLRREAPARGLRSGTDSP